MLVNPTFSLELATDPTTPVCPLPAPHTSSYVLLVSDTVIRFAEIQAEESSWRRRRWMNSAKRKTSEKQRYVISRSYRDWAIKQPAGETSPSDSHGDNCYPICQGHSGSAEPTTSRVPRRYTWLLLIAFIQFRRWFSRPDVSAEQRPAQTRKHCGRMKHQATFFCCNWIIT